jgi:hypothetical protein
VLLSAGEDFSHSFGHRTGDQIGPQPAPGEIVKTASRFMSLLVAKLPVSCDGEAGVRVPRLTACIGRHGQLAPRKRFHAQRTIIMPNVELKTGSYKIHANKRQEFTFWWGSDAVPAAYFDVSIEPNPTNPNMIPLIEEQRTVTLFNGAPRQPMLIVTLINNNDFDVEFFANHVRVYI